MGSRRFAFGAALAVVGLAVLLALQPQIVVLAGEGFPDPEWPVPGAFVPIAGDDRPLGRETAPIPDAALDRFAASGGKALVVVRDGRLVAEHYAEGYSSDTRLNSYSLVKTLVGALTVRAVADGEFALDTPISTLLPPAMNWVDASSTWSLADVTVEDVLAMRGALVAAPEPAKAASGARDKTLDDAAFSPFGTLAKLHAYGPDALVRRMRVRANGRGAFRYQSAYTALLGLMLERAYGRSLPDLLSELIWKPAGAARADWRRYPRDQRATAYCCLYARPVDWARVGAFLLANGTPDEPFLPRAPWSEFILPDLGPARREGVYGWHIRHDVLDREGEPLSGPFAYAMGHDGQIMYLLPDHDAVVVRFGATPQLLHSTLYELAPLLLRGPVDRAARR